MRQPPRRIGPSRWLRRKKLLPPLESNGSARHHDPRSPRRSFLSMEPFVSFLGLFVLMFLAWLMSSNRNVVNLRVVVGGLLLQFAMAYLVLRTKPGQAFFEAAGRAFNELLGCVDA